MRNFNIMIISEYETLGKFIFGCFFISGILFLISWVLSPRIRSSNRVYSYECGFSPFTNNKVNFNSQIYQIAILFIIFDTEIVLLFPSIYAEISLPSHYLTVYTLLLVLMLGLVAEIKAGLIDFYR